MKQEPEMTIDTEGTKYWYLNGELHREDGPAAEYTNGAKFWCLNGKLHREDGPAVELTNGNKLWWLNGEGLSVEEFIAILLRKQLEMI